jgi:hypothetical protein
MFRCYELNQRHVTSQKSEHLAHNTASQPTISHSHLMTTAHLLQ